MHEIVKDEHKSSLSTNSRKEIVNIILFLDIVWRLEMLESRKFDNFAMKDVKDLKNIPIIVQVISIKELWWRHRLCPYNMMKKSALVCNELRKVP